MIISMLLPLPKTFFLKFLELPSEPILHSQRIVYSGK